ncbi:MAG: Rrf2 family transcriptional regulator [Anaerolineae bacterium]|nr:Rrf2 family transcriptional regulator [Anaerolineae bacterium]
MSYSHGFTQALYLMLYVGDKIEQGMYEFIPTQKISEDLNIPPSSAASILSRLNRAGLIETREGAGGGVRLLPCRRRSPCWIFWKPSSKDGPCFSWGISSTLPGANRRRRIWRLAGY